MNLVSVINLHTALQCMQETTEFLYLFIDLLIYVNFFVVLML